MFNCYNSIHDVIYHAELGSSAAIFRAGYTIDSLMLRYKGVNWTDPQNHNCNAGCAPNSPTYRMGCIHGGMQEQMH